MDHRSWFSLLKYYAAIGSFMLMVNISLADTIRQTVEIYQPVLITRGIYTSFQLDGGFHYSEPGKPDLPFITVNFLLPPGHVIDEVIIEEKGIPVWFENTVPIPVNRQYPVSVKFADSAADLMLATPDSSVYLGKSPYPGNLCGTFSTQFLSGHSIGVVTLNPLLYYPDKQAVQLNGLIVLKVITRPFKNALAALSLLKDKAHVTRQITEWVSNQDALADYQHYYSKRSEVFDLLIITDESFISDFDEYIYHKLRFGIKSQMISVQNIVQSYEGVDIQEKIRNCVIDQYQSSGISHVLLAGDADAADPAHNLVPHRGFYVETYTGGETDADIPSDMYYACLDGNWNNDGDEYWGEPGEEDLFSELTVGRICADDITELQNQLQKVIRYESEPVLPDISNALMLGEMLTQGTFGGNYKTEVAHGSDHNGYTTAGFPDDYEVSELYEMNTLWEKDDLLNFVNGSGAHWINHLGHADNTWCLKMPDHFVNETNLTNNGINRGLNIVYSQGCYNTAFDNRTASATYTTDCITEIAQGIASFQAAAIGNSRYGWYMTNSTAGASQYFDRQFFDAIFGEGIPTIGQANAGSKEDNAGYILNNRYIRWCAYELNLLGDPSMQVFSHVPETVLCSHPQAVHLSDTGIIITSNMENLNIAIIQDSILTGEGTTGPDGFSWIKFQRPLSVNTPLELYASGKNSLIYHQNIRVWNEGPCLVLDSIWYVQNGIVKADSLVAGDSVQISVIVRNAGNAISADVGIEFDSDQICFINSILSVAPLQPGEQKEFSGMVTGFIPGNAPDLTSLKLRVTMEDASTHTYFFQPLLIKPQLIIQAGRIDDQLGNNNGAPDPGESVRINLRIVNSGHAPSRGGVLCTDASTRLIEILNPAVPVAGLQPFTDTLITIEITPDSILPVSFPFEIFVNLISENTDTMAYSGIRCKMGSPVENFETADFQRYPWEFGGNQPWIMDTISSVFGHFSARSGNIGHNQESRIMITLISMVADSLAFDYRVSSEPGYDFLYFYMDGLLKGRWAGESGWKTFSLAVDAGLHTFEWVYKKDVYFSQGEDVAHIDNIRLPLPVNEVVFAGPDLVSCHEEPLSPHGWINGISAFGWNTVGDGYFDDIHTLRPLYYPGERDRESGIVSLVLSGSTAQGAVLNDSLTAFILSIPDVPAVHAGKDTVCVNFELNTVFEVPPVSGAEDYYWELEPPGAGTLITRFNQAMVTWNGFTGDAFIRVKAFNKCGYSGFSDPDRIHLKVCETLANSTVFPQITVWPNPSEGSFNISVNPGVKIAVSLTGTQGYYHEWVFDPEKYADGIHISGINPGLYVLQIHSAEYVWIGKIMISL